MKQTYQTASVMSKSNGAPSPNLLLKVYNPYENKVVKFTTSQTSHKVNNPPNYQVNMRNKIDDKLYVSHQIAKNNIAEILPQLWNIFQSANITTDQAYKEYLDTQFNIFFNQIRKLIATQPNSRGLINQENKEDILQNLSLLLNIFNAANILSFKQKSTYLKHDFQKYFMQLKAITKDITLKEESMISQFEKVSSPIIEDYMSYEQSYKPALLGKLYHSEI
jgi:hypothetical protein